MNFLSVCDLFWKLEKYQIFALAFKQSTKIKWKKLDLSKSMTLVEISEHVTDLDKFNLVKFAYSGFR